MKKFIVICAAVLILASCGKKEEEPKVIFAYFSGYRCPPCMQFKLDYLNDFQNTYKEKYRGRVELREYMTDIPIDLTDQTSAEYKTAKKMAEENSAVLGATGKMYGVKWVGGIPMAVIGDTVLDDFSDDSALNKENVERAIDKAIKNNETTKLALKLSGRAEDYTDMLQAARAGDYQAVKSFLDKGADVNQSDVIDGQATGYTALTSAAFGGSTDIVKLLLAHKADINIKTNWDATALTMAAMFGRRDVVELLLSKGADVYAGLGAVVAAAEGTDQGMIQLLKRHGADVNKKLKDGTTPLMYIVSQRDDGKGGAGTKIAIEAARILIDEGANVNAKAVIKNKDGKTVTKTVLQSAKSDAMKNFLISKGAK